jgi:tryptophan-rich sensory protein
MPATPILDFGVLPPARPKKRALGLVIGACMGILFAVIVEKTSSTQSQTNLTLLSYLAILTLAVTIHELGHLAAGWLVGFRFSLISIRPLSLRVEYGQLKFRLQRDSSSLGYAGMRIGSVRRMRLRFLIFIAAGPAANLLSGPLSPLLVRYIFPSLLTTWVAPFAAGFAALSLLIGAMSLVPFGSNSRSDGARIWMLLTSSSKTRRWITAAALVQQQAQGVRLKRWKRTWLKAVCSVRDASLSEFLGNMLAYLAANDRKDTVTAAAHLERCLELAHLIQPPARDIVAREAAIFCAWFRGNPNLADRWLAQMKRPKQTTSLLQIRTDIALDCARGKFDEALGNWQKGASSIERLPPTPVKVSLTEGWIEWGAEIRERQCQTTSV